MNISEIVKRKGFIVTVEMNPPKGPDCDPLLRNAENMAPWVDAINVTDGAGAVMRLSSISLCHRLRDIQIECVYQLTCRDRNRIALQADLLSASALGIENVLCLTGDHVGLGDHPDAKPVYDLDSVSLLATVTRLNGGRDLHGNPLASATRLCAGAAVNPNAFPLEPQILKLKRKIQSGAQFIQTQAVFDPPKLNPLVALTQELKVPLIVGILLLTSGEGVRSANRHISGVRISEAIGSKLENSSDPSRTGVEIAASLIKEVRKAAQGVHLMNVGPKTLESILQKAGLS